MPYYHNMIGGPSDIEHHDNVDVTVKKLVPVLEVKSFDHGNGTRDYTEFRLDEDVVSKKVSNAPDMMIYRKTGQLIRSNGLRNLTQEEMDANPLQVLDPAEEVDGVLVNLQKEPTYIADGHTEGNSLN